MRAADLYDEIGDQIRKEAWRVKSGTPGGTDPAVCGIELMSPVSSGGITRPSVADR